VLRPERAGGITGIQDLVDNGLRLVNRKPGTEGLLDRDPADAGIQGGGQLPGYDTRAAGHPEVAAAIAAGLADAGIASEPAALAHDPARCRERIATLPPQH
jgi:molybdate-binding protein